MPDPRGVAGEPLDPDLGTAIEQLKARAARAEGRILAVISLGGVIGAVGRYEAGLWWPTRSDAMPWTTLGINVLGSALLAVVIVVATELWTDRPWLRPFLGTGVLGGFTTFSTFALDNRRLLSNGHASVAASYIASTLLACAAATWLGGVAARAAFRRWSR
jgi:CrcB protein